LLPRGPQQRKNMMMREDTLPNGKKYSPITIFVLSRATPGVHPQPLQAAPTTAAPRIARQPILHTRHTKNPTCCCWGYVPRQ
jgi:hypothetical protein